MKSSNRNWAEYNRSLVNRGSLTFWISEDVLKGWEAAHNPTKRGHPFLFSDTAIIVALSLRFVYRLSLRATEGLVRSILQMMSIPLMAPGYTAICKRMKFLKIPSRLKKGGVRTLVLDASGLKVYGEGEWKVKKHGPGRRRKWKKIHLAMDAKTQEIVFCEVSKANVVDTEYFEKWVRGKSLQTVIMDGAADTSKCYRHAEKEGVKLLTPPQRNALIREEGWFEQRNTALKQIIGFGGGKIGRELWRILTGYTKRAIVESVFSRWKRILGGEMRSQTEERQCAEVYCKSMILNRMRRSQVVVI